ncbi:MAG: prepilin peptidase [Acidimicrobiia bacterium]
MIVAAVGGGVLGLIVGSFLNVVAHRVPSGQSIVRPPSACPHCGTAILPRDNVPVLSWFLLRGKCRACAEPISRRYPLVEATAAVLFAVTPAVVGATWILPAYWWFVGVSLVLILTDLDHHRIPNAILYPGVVVGVVLLAIGAAVDGDLGSLGRGAGGGLAYFGFLFVVALVAKGGLGFGDVKLAVLLGLFTAYQSWGILAVSVFAAVFLGGLVAVGLLVAGRKGRKDVIPFGPPMVVGAYVALVVGEQIADWYVG